MSITHLVSMIPDWLAVTASREVSIGLTREDALGRAGVLRRLLRNGGLDPEHVVLDEDLKAVFHALVALVTEIEPLEGAALTRETDAVYQFLLLVEWKDDHFEEKAKLLADCARVGLTASGRSCGSVRRVRLALSNHEPLEFAGVASRQVRKALVRCASLRDRGNVSPGGTALESERLYRRLGRVQRHAAIFDDIDFLLGEAALVAAIGHRHLGNAERALLWLSRAEKSYRRTLFPMPALLDVASERLSLECNRRHYSRVLEVASDLAARCDRAKLWRTSLKCRLIRAVCLKELNREGEAIAAHEALRTDPMLERDSSIKAAVLVGLSNLLDIEDRHNEAADLRGKTLAFVLDSNQPIFVAYLQGVTAEALRDQGRFDEAVSSYRLGISSYHHLGMATFEAYMRVLLAETLVLCGRHSEAESEILQALPTIEEQQMVPEGFAAVALLRESVRRQKTNPEALRQLREHLQRQH